MTKEKDILTSAVSGFLDDGLRGMLKAVDAIGSSIEDDVEDPEALRAAEDAVMGDDRVPAGMTGKARIDEIYSVVATQLAPGDHLGLEDVARSLESDGIDFGWDPFDPRDAVAFKPPASGLFAGKLVSIVVPASQVGRARQSLYGAAPAGVSYPWSEGDEPLFYADDAAASATAQRPAPTGPGDGVAVHGDPAVSDNARLAQLAGGGTSVGRVIVIVMLVIIVLTIGFVTFVFGRG